MNTVIVKCHDEQAMTYDILNVKMMNDGIDYLDCIEEANDYELYSDVDIANLTSKIYANYETFKKNINQAIRSDFDSDDEKSFKMNGFMMIVEKGD